MRPVEFDLRHLAYGLYLSGDRNLPYGAIRDGAAARFIRKTGIHTGPGYYRNVTLGTALPVDSLWGSGAAGLATLFARSGTKLYHGVNVENRAYDLGLTLTSGERNAFVEARNGDIFTFNQVDSPARIATGALTAALTDLTTGEMTLGASVVDKFAASGTVYAAGVSYTYSGKSATALTGLGGGPLPAGGLAVGTLVTQTSTPASFAVAKGTCGMIVEGSMLVAGVKGREDIVFISAPSTFDDPQFVYDFDDNGASAKVMPAPVTGMVQGNSLSYIFGSRFVESSPGFNVETNVFQTNPVTQNYGAYNPRCVTVMGGRACFLGGKRLIPIDIRLNGEGVATGRPDEDFDAPIKPWLEQFDDEADQTDVAEVEYNITAGILSITGSIEGTRKTRFFDNRDKLKCFGPEEVRPFRCRAFWDGKSYFGSDTLDRVFIDYTSLTNDGFPILHRWETTEMELANGRQEVHTDNLLFDGYMSQDCEFTLNVYIDGSSEPAYTLDFDDSVITSETGVALGLRVPGLNLMGGGGDTPMLVYRYDVEVDLSGLSGESFRLEWVCSTLGGYLEVDSALMNGRALRFTRRSPQ